ncbi:MAG: hypothetical protein CL608_06560 [Anaerolineaceae bacterium]|nr:hypothetical protein [Anaerolineaceae bacterium]
MGSLSEITGIVHVILSEAKNPFEVNRLAALVISGFGLFYPYRDASEDLSMTITILTVSLVRTTPMKTAIMSGV